jgi:hypothetical protein
MDSKVNRAGDGVINTQMAGKFLGDGRAGCAAQPAIRWQKLGGRRPEPGIGTDRTVLS